MRYRIKAPGRVSPFSNIPKFERFRIHSQTIFQSYALFFLELLVTQNNLSQKLAAFSPAITVSSNADGVRNLCYAKPEHVLLTYVLCITVCRSQRWWSFFLFIMEPGTKHFRPFLCDLYETTFQHFPVSGVAPKGSALPAQNV